MRSRPPPPPVSVKHLGDSAVPPGALAEVRAFHYRSSLNERSSVALPKAASQPLSTREVAAWRGFLRTHARLLRQLDRQLTDEQGLPISSYEVLLRLAEAPSGTMRMKDIATSLLLSRSGLSRIVDELERKGYVARQPCASDARGTEAVITRSGRSVFRKAQNSHLRSVRSEFLDKLSKEQQRQLAEAWTAVGLALAPDTDYGS
jgi:DNA-binding MarR family transcriptional regulator